jgi:hypothetical protein
MEVFNDSFVPEGLAELWFSQHPCPRCGRRSLSPTHAGDDVHWLCRACGHCWRPVHGSLRGVDPLACAGCARSARGDCIGIVYGDFPRFGAMASQGDG